MDFDPIYAKTARDMWVRATVTDAGIAVAVQERWVRDGALVVAYGVDAVEVWRRPIYEVEGAAPWIPAGEVMLDARWADLGGAALDWPDLVRGGQRHLTALIAAGWGDTLAEVLGWFADPIELMWLIPGQAYEVVGEYEPLVGFAGMFLTVEEDDATWVRFLGLDMPRLMVDSREWVRALLIATHPVVRNIGRTE